MAIPLKVMAYLPSFIHKSKELMKKNSEDQMFISKLLLQKQNKNEVKMLR